MGKIILSIFGGVLLMYLVWIAFIPMAIGGAIGGKFLERKVIENSHQYIVSQTSAMNTLYTAYTEAEGEHKQAIKTQICDIALTLNSSELKTNIRTLCR